MFGRWHMWNRLAGLGVAGVLAIELLAAGSPSPGGPGVIYQPQTRDATLPAAAWQRIFTNLADDGVEALVLQWTRHGDEDFGGADEWLGDVANHAAKAGLSVRVGLHWDPNWFDRVTDGHTPLADYLSTIMRANRVQAQAWSHWRDREAFGGWYLPSELPDRVFRHPEAQRVLRRAITKLRRDLGAPLAVSSYFQGAQPPVTYARWLMDLRTADVDVWVQDGVGDSPLPESERGRYLAALPCPLGVIEEHFLRVGGSGEAFRAVPAKRDRQWSNTDTDCRERVFFSLRYLQAARGVLPL